MTTDPLDTPTLRERLAGIRDALDARPIDPDSIPDEPPAEPGYRG
jgi:hypothetical protein